MNQVQHGGDIYRNKIRYDFSVNLNPLGMPSGVVKVLQEQAGDWGCYPDPECRRLVDELARLHQVPETFLLCGNGAADLIFQLVQAVRPARAVVPAPAFLEYQQALKAAGCVTEHVLPQGDPGEHGWRILPASLAGYIRDLTDGCDLVFFCNPNNPTGALATIEELEPLLAQCQRQQAFLVIDEDDPFGERHPREAMLPELVLLLCRLIREKADEGVWKKRQDDCIVVSIKEFQEEMHHYRNRYRAAWSKEYREMEDAKLLKAVISYMKSWMMVDECDGEIVIYPAAGKMIGRYPAEFETKEKNR